MADEQLIYLDPNDDLNRVTERLEETTKQRVVIIVPQQTHLRSNVLWRVLSARANAMGREVIIVSADRQVRSLARIAGFRVADNQDSSSTGKGRTGSSGRAFHAPSEGRRGRQSRSPFERRSAGNRDIRDTRGNRDVQAGNPPVARVDTTQERPQQSAWRQAESHASQAGEKSGEQGPAMGAPMPDIEEEDFDQPFEFRAGASQAAPLQPLPPLNKSADEQELEQDPFLPDYETSRRFRESWQGGQPSQAAQSDQPAQFSPSAQPAQPGQFGQPDQSDRTFQPDIVGVFPVPPAGFEPTSSAPGPRSTSPDRDALHRDPFEEMEDKSFVSLPEQRGAAFVEELDDGIPDIAEKADEIAAVHEIEDLGEDEEGFVDTQNISQRQWPEMFDDEPEEEYEPRRVYGSQPRSSRSGGLARRRVNDFGDADQLAPVEDRPTVTPIVPVQPARPGPLPARQSGNLAAARAGSGAVPPPQRVQRNVTLPPAMPNIPQPGQANRTRAPAAPPAPRRAAAQAQQSRRGSRVLAAFLVIILLLLLVGAGFFYFGTSATVTLTVPWTNIPASNIQLIASTSSQNNAQHIVASQVLSYTASAMDSVPATGSTPHGGAAASGIALFTNNGSQPVHIPTGTTISTPAGTGTAGIQFVTEADFVISAISSFPGVPIQAVNPGSSGNVGANKITVIPADSLTAIAKLNNVSTSSLNLSVTNPAPLTGGGTKSAPAATSNDITKLKLKLHQKIQAQLNSWLQTQLHGLDQRGTLMPDVPGSKTPLKEEVLSQTPAVGQPLSSNSISGTMTVPVRVLVVRQDKIRAAAEQQLNAIALKMNPKYTITTDEAPVQISNIASRRSSDGTTLTITFNARGQAVLYVDKNMLSSYVAGKTVDQATSGIDGGDYGIQGVQNVDIAVTPSFLNFLPFRSEHIHIIVRPGKAAPNTPAKPNG